MIRKVILTGFFLAGCIASNQSSLTKAVSLQSNDQIIISAPNGFCVDQNRVKKASDAITLFIVDCVSLDNSGSKKFVRRPVSAILTATVISLTDVELDDVERLREFFTTQPGINYLSRSNINNIFKLHEVQKKDKILLFLIEQRPDDIGVTRSNYFWRAFILSNKKIISLTASNFSENDLAIRRLKKLILELSNNILLANLK